MPFFAQEITTPGETKAVQAAIYFKIVALSGDANGSNVDRLAPEEVESRAAFLLQLIQSAARRSFVGAPAEKTRPMPKPLACDVVVGYFHHQLRFERLPFR